MASLSKGPSGTRRRAAAGAAAVAASLAGLLTSVPAPARAAAGPPPAAICAPEPGDGPVALAAVSDEGDVTAADGRLLRLAGLDPPRNAPGSDLPARFRAALLELSAGPLALRALGPSDRWGRVPALLFTADPPADVGAVLISAGLARTAPEGSVHACSAARLAAEEAARAAGRGLWAGTGAAVLAADDAAGLAAQAGEMALVQGVLHLHESRGALYLWLGRATGAGRRGFVAVVSRRDVKRFMRAGLDLRDYAGTPVRLRGDLDVRFGPRLRVTEPDAVESLEPGSIPAEK